MVSAKSFSSAVAFFASHLERRKSTHEEAKEEFVAAENKGDVEEGEGRGWRGGTPRGTTGL